MSSASVRFPDTRQVTSLTDMLQTKLVTPATSKTLVRGALRTVLDPRGSSKPEWRAL
jgi:hypothetical protein